MYVIHTTLNNRVTNFTKLLQNLVFDMHSKVSWLFLEPRNTLTPSVAVETNKESTAAYCLSKLPGKVLELCALLANNKFRGRGNKGHTGRIPSAARSRSWETFNYFSNKRSFLCKCALNIIGT